MNRISILAMVIGVACVQACNAQTTRPTVSASLGFSGVFKPDAWTPIYARVIDPDGPRAATLEVRTARGKLGHDVISRISTNRSASTFTLYAPIGTLDRVSLQLRDERGNLLRAIDLTDAAQSTPAALGGPAFGVAGGDAEAQHVVNQLFNDSGEYVAAGSLAARLLPERTIGYASIDVLVLPSLDADSIDDVVQTAIVAWVRAGGVIITWPGATAPTRSSPLVNQLPATIGDPSEFAFEGRTVIGRQLLKQEQAADVFELSAGSIFERRLGLGQIVQLAFDPTKLSDTSQADRIALWRRLTAGQFSMSPDDRRVGVFDPLVAQAVGEQQLPAAIVKASTLSQTIALTGFFVGLLLGPGELLLLAAGRRHPRTWYTAAGLAMTVGCGIWWCAIPQPQADPQNRIDIRIESPDGLDASIAIATRSDADLQTHWLTADRTDPSLQPAAELTLAQREAAFDDIAQTSIGGGNAKVRAIRYSTDVLHPDHIAADLAMSMVSNASKEPWEAVAIVRRQGIQLTREPVQPGGSFSFAGLATITADNGSTRRVETGIERLAAEPGWAALLMDRRLSERLVRLLETEDVTIIATRDVGAKSFVLHVVRR